MKIALDYDGTYNTNRKFWNDFCQLTREWGHQVYIVTARSPHKDRIPIDRLPPLELIENIIYCDGIAKKWHLHHHYDLDIDIWIDDRPDNILNNSPATKEVLAAWRTSPDYVK